MNTKPIDIIIPYVNPLDKTWQASFNYWSNKERGVTSSNRFRDIGSLKYVFRSIEANCKWVNKVFLVLSSKEQIPDWLNTDNPKLRIVYHDEYIPANLLPTFNSNTILMHFNRIADLSDNFILSNDDVFFMRPISSTFFFDNDKPKGQYKVDLVGFKPAKNNYFLQELNNNVKLIQSVVGSPLFLHHFHFALANNKTFWNFCWHKFNKQLSTSFSRFRTATNYTDWLFHDLGLATKHVTDTANMYRNCKFICCTNNPRFEQFNAAVMACFNDDMSNAAYERVKTQFNTYMSKRFPKKSSFEK